MSNLWFNIRFGIWHFQSSPDEWFKIGRNDHWLDKWKSNPIGIYCLFGRHFNH